MIAPRVSNSQPPLFMPWQRHSEAGAAARAEAVVTRPGRARVDVGESTSGANLLDCDVAASKPVPLHVQMLHVASATSVVGDCCFGSGNERLAPAVFDAAGFRPERQRPRARRSLPLRRARGLLAARVLG